MDTYLASCAGDAHKHHPVKPAIGAPIFWWYRNWGLALREGGEEGAKPGTPSQQAMVSSRALGSCSGPLVVLLTREPSLYHHNSTPTHLSALLASSFPLTHTLPYSNIRILAPRPQNA